MGSQRLVVAILVGASLGVAGLVAGGPNRPKGGVHPPAAPHPNPPSGGASHPGIAPPHPIGPGGGGTIAPKGGPHPVDSRRSMRAAFLSRTSQTEQQLRSVHHAHFQHHLHDQWRWGAALFVPVPTAAGLVTGVPNGSTLTVLNRANVPQRVRLFGAASPLQNQAFFSASQEHLAGLADQQFVNVYEVGTDPDGTMVAQVFLRDSTIYLNDRQIRDGMAWNFADDGFAPDLASAEEDAQARRAGLWADEYPTAPWLYASE
jgi:micrococcal nuclease